MIKTKSKNLFLKRIAKHLGSSFNSEEFFEDCNVILGEGGATNYFVYCHDNREFLKKNKDLIADNILEYFDDMGESPRNYQFSLFGQELDNEIIAQILGFLYGKKIPEQGQACDWLVWASVDNEIYAREEEIKKRKWD